MIAAYKDVFDQENAVLDQAFIDAAAEALAKASNKAVTADVVTTLNGLLGVDFPSKDVDVTDPALEDPAQAIADKVSEIRGEAGATAPVE
jgi:hypothetical protein